MCFITTKKLNKLLDEIENKKKDNMGPLNMDWYYKWGHVMEKTYGEKVDEKCIVVEDVMERKFKRLLTDDERKLIKVSVIAGTSIWKTWTYKWGMINDRYSNNKTD